MVRDNNCGTDVKSVPRWISKLLQYLLELPTDERADFLREI